MPIRTHHIESELGSWTHSEWCPAAGNPLAPVVERIWDFEGALSSGRERVFPTGAVELIVQLDDRYSDVEPGSIRRTPATCITGVQTGPMVIQAPDGRTRVLGVRFQPPGAWGVLGVPMSELTDLTVDMEDASAALARELADRCADATDSAGRVRAARQMLHDACIRAPQRARPDIQVSRAATRIAASGGATRISALKAELGIDTHRLASLFREQVGVTPKVFARIHRFRRALQLLQAGPPPPRMTELALSTGYYDQAHMVSEFRELAGLTPGQVLVASRYAESVNTADR